MLHWFPKLNAQTDILLAASSQSANTCIEPTRVRLHAASILQEACIEVVSEGGVSLVKCGEHCSWG